MSMLSKKITVGAKTESVSGTQVTLAQADFNFKPYGIQVTTDREQIERNYMVGSLAPFSNLVGKSTGTVAFSVDFAEATTSGETPNYAKLLAACGMKVTDAGSSITLELDDTINFSNTLTIEVVHYEENSSPVQSVKTFKGCMGKCKANCDDVGAIISIDFEFAGAFVGESDRTYASRLTPTAFESSTAGVFLNGTSTYNSVAMKLSKFTLDFGQELAIRVDPAEPTGVQGYGIVGIRSTFEGEILLKPEATDGLAAAFAAGTCAALAITLGSTLTIAAPRMQITKVSYGDRGGYATKNITGLLCRSVSDALVETGYPLTLTLA